MREIRLPPSCLKLPQRHPRGWGQGPSALVKGNRMAEFFLHSFNTLSHGFIGYIIPFLFVLTIVVFFHELGHFLVARWAGVKVLTFSLGFGPELAGFNDRHGTRWKISAIPARRLCQVLRRRKRGLDAIFRSARQHDRRRARRQLPSQEGWTARGDRGRRSDREFPSGDRDLYRAVHVLRQAKHDRRASTKSRRAAPRLPPALRSATS